MLLLHRKNVGGGIFVINDCLFTFVNLSSFSNVLCDFRDCKM